MSRLPLDGTWRQGPAVTGPDAVAVAAGDRLR
jgi:hypothetical protein